MANWIDFQEVKARVSLETVLFDFYRIDNLRRHGKKAVGPCPVHGGDSPRAFHADFELNVWHCFTGCKGGGNQLDLVVKKDGISLREAAIKLRARYMVDSATLPGADRSDSKPTPAEIGKEQEVANDDHERLARNPPLSVELQLKREHPHLTKDRGLQPETIEHFDIGYCSRGIMRATIAIPIHNAEGERVAYAGRRLKPSEIDSKGKYRFPKGFRKDLELYNYHRAVMPMHSDGLILVEGFFTVMKLYEAGFENVAAVMGCSLSVDQAALAAAANEVIIMFDGNKAGRTGAQAAAELLGDDCIVRVADLPDDYEPEDLGPRGLRWLIRGMRALDLAYTTFRPRRPGA